MYILILQVQYVEDQDQDGVYNVEYHSSDPEQYDLDPISVSCHLSGNPTTAVLHHNSGVGQRSMVMKPLECTMPRCDLDNCWLIKDAFTLKEYFHFDSNFTTVFVYVLKWQ